MYAEGKIILEAILKESEQIDKSSIEVGKILNGLGGVLMYLGRYEDSLKQYESSLLIKEKHYGKDHVYVAITKENIGLVLMSFRKV